VPGTSVARLLLASLARRQNRKPENGRPGELAGSVWCDAGVRYAGQPVHILAGHEGPPCWVRGHGDHRPSSLRRAQTELRRELAETKAQLATAHGELLALRRRPGPAASQD